MYIVPGIVHRVQIIVLRTSVTLLVSRSEYPRDKPFLLTMISYFKKLIKIKREKRIKFPRALSELSVNWPGRLFSQKGWLDLVS